jgi:two-component system cell cycle sensor histidine kinase/response regulator CckA
MEKAQILIVEDDAIIAMDIESQLKQLGYGVTAKVGYGEQAIEKVKENTPDVVLMDIILKGEMDGIDAAREIHTQFDIPVVFLTAFADKNRLERAKLAYPFGFILKPFQNKDLEITIEMALYVAKVDAERKQAEMALREERSFAESIINTAQVIILVLDVKGRIVRFNPYMEEISGYSLDEVQGKDWFATFLPAKEHKIIRDLFQKAVGDIQTRGNVNPIVTKGGSERQIEWYDKTLRDADKNVTGLLAIGLDVTERKRAEEALQESEEKYRVIFENIQDVYYESSLDGIILEISPSVENISKYKRDELIGKSLYDLYTNPDERDKLIKVILSEGTVRNFEINLTDKDGSQNLCSINASVIVDEQGNPLKFVGSMRDIVKLTQTAEALRESEEK